MDGKVCRHLTLIYRLISLFLTSKEDIDMRQWSRPCHAHVYTRLIQRRLLQRRHITLLLSTIIVTKPPRRPWPISCPWWYRMPPLEGATLKGAPPLEGATLKGARRRRQHLHRRHHYDISWESRLTPCKQI